jgi:hypothetical protein
MRDFNFDQSFNTLSVSHNALLESLNKIKNEIPNAWSKPKEKFLEASGAFSRYNGQLLDKQRAQIQQLFFHTEGDNGSQAVTSSPGTPNIMSVLDEIIKKLQSLKSSLEIAMNRTGYDSKKST